VVPYRKLVIETVREERGGKIVDVPRRKFVTGSRHFLPETVVMTGMAVPQERRRGIYRAQAYSGDWEINGHFEVPADFGVGMERGRYSWGKPEIHFGVTDPRGLAPEMALNWDGIVVVMQPGSGLAGLGRGIHAQVDIDQPGAGKAQSVAFEMRLGLTGLSRMQFLPTGRSSEVRLSSSWPHPGFSGPLLADHRIDGNGFRATWKTSYLANNLQQEYSGCFEAGRCDGFNATAFGVDLVEPANLYQQLERSAKYGLLFVGLTFIAFFLFDVLKQCPIHPVQYALVGGALVIFYLLLTSLAEHIPFAAAYAISAGVCIALIGYYIAHVIGSWQRGTLVGAMLALLYGVLFAILRSEDNALLMGSILLFAFIAAIMIGTRKVDWYRLGSPASPARDAGYAMPLGETAV
ncbi:MAG: cell envelope integrity protein CreD, partial [Betaproteobacteria bacterium]